MSDLIIDNLIVRLLDIEEIDNLILKGHIMTEYGLEFFIEINSVQKADKRTKFTYSNKMAIAQALGLFKRAPELKSELKCLNKLRNEIAHNLKYEAKTLHEFLKHYNNVKNKGGIEFAKKLAKFEKINLSEKDDIEHFRTMMLMATICLKIFGIGKILEYKDD